MFKRIFTLLSLYFVLVGFTVTTPNSNHSETTQVYPITPPFPGASGGAGGGDGDITSVSAGAGLSGGAATGAVNLDVEVTLPIEIVGDTVACPTCETQDGAQAKVDTRQPLDADLTALANPPGGSFGLWARTGDGTGAARAITAGSSKLSVSNGSGVSGNPSIDVVPANVLLQSLGGAVTDAQVPDLDTLGSGVTPLRCVETDASGFFVAADDLCGTGSGSSPGGTDTQIQFNDDGAFGGDSDFTWNKTTNTLSFGDCTTDCITDDPSAITGQKTRTRLNATGHEAASDAVLTAGLVPSVDSSGLLTDGFSLTKLRTRKSGFMIGSDGGDPLADTDDQADIFVNGFGSNITILEVFCKADAGSPTIQLQKNDGTPTDMLSSDLTCPTTLASTTSFVSGENVIADDNLIDYKTVSAGGTAARISIFFTYRID